MIAVDDFWGFFTGASFVVLWLIGVALGIFIIYMIIRVSVRHGMADVIGRQNKPPVPFGNAILDRAEIEKLKSGPRGPKEENLLH